MYFSPKIQKNGKNSNSPYKRKKFHGVDFVNNESMDRKTSDTKASLGYYYKF